MLLGKDFVAHRHTQASAFSGFFCCEEGVEDFLHDGFRNTGAVVFDGDKDAILVQFGAEFQGWIVAILLVLKFLVHGEACVVGNIQKDSGEVR